ncbi:DUF4012 domain-containing protein [Candidatus Uhrbacteria bacterium]|nr:DUF4012 domain-containing protein [Candidatus Uhrbacteria bacterium]
MIVACVVLAGVVVLGALLVVGAGRIAGGLATTKAAAADAEDALRAGDFLTADTALTDAEAGVSRAQSGVRLVVFLRPVPWVGTQLKGLALTLDAAAETLAALHEAVRIVADISTVTKEAQALVDITERESVPYADLATSARVALLESLHDAYPDLLTMQLKLSLAKDDLARLAALDVSPMLTDAVAPFAELIDPLADAVNLLTPFAAAVPELAGLGEDRQFLLLFANDTELRPGGGFLGVFALAITRDGEIVNLAAEDVYRLDQLVADDGYQVTPPTPLARYLGVPKWYFRDSNWSPDFPASAKDSVQLLRQEVAYAGQPVPEVHGALMFTPTFIARLLAMTGPVTVDDQTFTSDNIADKLEYQVEIGYAEQGLPPHQRKEVVARMTDIVVDRLLALPASEWPELFGILTEGFSEKELALWSADEETQAIYHDAGWSGEVAAGGSDDVLMVVDANLGALKTDPEVDREIAYTVTPSGEGYEATVAITYTNNASFTWKTTRYRTYTRVYAPLGSELVSSSGTLDNDTLLNPSGKEGEVTTVDELGMTSFGAFTSIEPGETRTLSVTYRLPQQVEDAIDAGVYELNILKQLGAADHDLVLNLTFGDMTNEVTYAVPGEDESDWGDNSYHYETVLDTDKSVMLRVK